MEWNIALYNLNLISERWNEDCVVQQKDKRRQGLKEEKEDMKLVGINCISSETIEGRERRVVKMIDWDGQIRSTNERKET